jgi:hypothetical protein
VTPRSTRCRRRRRPRRPRRRQLHRRRQEDRGLAITGAVSYVKVGSTAGPRARFEALRSEAHRVGSTVTRAWLSPAHPGYQTSESRTLAACRAPSPSSTPRSEYFHELNFGSARCEAAKAVLGIRDQPRVSTKTLAAGLHEPVSAAVQRRLAPSIYDGTVTLLGVWRSGGVSGCGVAAVPGLWSDRGGSAGSAGDLVPDGEADGHFGSVVGGGHQVAVGSEVG